MKVLIIYGGNRGGIAPFVSEQVESLNKLGVQTEYFLIQGKGIWGYLKNFSHLKQKINAFQPDILHAHYGLSGLLANLQKKVPVITTYHGSDINLRTIRQISKISMVLSFHNIFVAQCIKNLVDPKKSSLIPCGVDMSLFFPIEKSVARAKLNLDIKKKYILFSSSFLNPVKNYNLAYKSIKLINNTNVEIIEFKGYSREESNFLLNAVDLALMTSISEGSPQFIKEAMACNCPIVSTDVGDVMEIIKDTKKCSIANNQHEISTEIDTILDDPSRTNGRYKISGMEIQQVAKKIFELYKTVY